MVGPVGQVTPLPTGDRELPPGSLSTPNPPGAPSAPMPSPRILSLVTAPTVVHAGDTVRWDVRTTRDVSAVTAKVAAYGFTLARVAPGHFTLAFSIPASVPFFFHGDYHLDVIAQAPTGATHADATIRFR